MKKLFATLTLILFFIFTPIQTFANDYNAVLFISTTNPSEIAGNNTEFDLVFNTLGNPISELTASIIIEGSANFQAMSFNAHPLLSSRLHDSQGLTIQNYETNQINPGMLEVTVRMTANGGTYNEGSSAVPIYQIGFPLLNNGWVKAYLNPAKTSVTYIDQAKSTVDIYTTASSPKVIQIQSSNPTSTMPTINSPRPSTTPYVKPTPTSQPSPTPDYTQEFHELQQEVDSLKNQVDQQSQDISLLKRLVQNITNFFNRIFRL
jgi:hypothetical protein